MSATKTDKKRRRQTHGPKARAEAARLLGEGLTVTEVARRLDLSRQTVSVWKNHVVAPAVAEEEARRAESFSDSVAEARAKLAAGALKAAEVLVEQLDSKDPAVRSLAARTLLDRVGVPRTERVEVEVPTEDLTALTDDELAELERLRAKAKGGR